MEKLLEIKNLSKSFGDHLVLNNITTDINKGDVLCLVGPSGGGKSTFLRSLNLLEIPTGGSIFFDGVEITNPKTNIDEVRKKIGMVFQHFNLFPHLTILENMTLSPINVLKLSKSEAEEKAKVLLTRVGLIEKAKLPAGSLTLLDRKRLEIARALGTRPKLLLLDEVAAGLTEVEVQQVMELVAALKKEKLTIIWIEHILDTMMYATDRLMCMSEGRNVILGNPAEVIQSDIVQELYLGTDDTK